MTAATWLRTALASAICLVASARPIAAKERAIAPEAIFRGETGDPYLLGLRAYVWGMPLVEAALIRERFAMGTGPGGGTPVNRFAHRRQLAGPEMRAGVGPNNDTVYSLAWADIADGPLILKAPDFGTRYYTFSINLADSSGDLSFGQRTHGGQLPPLFLHGPGFRGKAPAGTIDVPVSTRYVNIAGRILVRGPQDYPEVHALQDKIALCLSSAWQQGRCDPPPERHPAPTTNLAAGTPPDLAFYAMLGNVLKGWTVRPQETRIVRSLNAIGLSPQNGFVPARLSAQTRAELARALVQGRRFVEERSLSLGVQQNGWTTNYLGPRFGTDYLLRAGVAKDQIFVTIPEEAIYPIGRVDAGGQRLSGRCRYRIRFGPDRLPPVGAFWSITAYGDQGWMISNSEDRYSIGDRTSALEQAPDGSITIILANSKPAEVGRANWLPISGQFYLMMRLYRPQNAVLNRKWAPPPIERLDCS